MRTRQLCVILVTLASILSLAAGPARADVLTLDQCIDIALRQNASVLTPGLKVGLTSARQSLWTAWGGLLPSVSGSVGHDYGWTPQTSEVVLTPPDTITGFPIILRRDTLLFGGSTYRWNARLGFQHTLFDGLANYYAIREAQQSLSGYRQQYRSVELSLILQVKGKYYAVLRAKGLLEVEKGAVSRAEKDLETIQSMFDLGSKSQSDLLKAKVRRGTEKVALITRQNEYDVAVADLNNLLNRDVSTAVDLAEVSSAPDLGISYEQAVREAEANSPQMLAARADWAVKRSGLGIARAAYLPALSWSGSRSFGSSERSKLFDRESGDWGVGVSLSYNFFDGFAKKSRYSTARVAARTSKENLTQQENDVALAVRQAYLGWQLAHDKMALADETEKSAQEDFNLAQEKYNLGAGTILELLDAQVSLTQAQTDVVNALYDYHLAIAALESAMGRGR